MKKLIKLLLIGLIVSSCSDSNSVTIPKEEYNKLKKDIESSKLIQMNEDGNTREYRISVGSDGHEYMSNCVYCNWKVLIHYPDCKKCKKDTL